MRSKLFATVSTLTVLLTMPCAASASGQENGTRHGWIGEVYTSDIPAAELPECLAALPAADLAARHFVKVYYRHVRRMLSTVAELPDQLQPKLNDQVEFWPGDCSNGKFSRITRISPTAS